MRRRGGVGTVWRALLAGALTIAAAAPSLAADWPEGLRDAAVARLAQLEAEEERIRDSTLEAPLGVGTDTVFDRPNHRCHEVAGQRYRIFGRPVLVGQEPEGTWMVQASVEVRFRQGSDLPDLYAQPWREGTDALFQIRFRPHGGSWKVLLERELLPLGR